MEQITILLLIVGLAIPITSSIGLFMIKSLNDLCQRVSRLEGRHQEMDKK